MGMVSQDQYGFGGCGWCVEERESERERERERERESAVVSDDTITYVDVGEEYAR